MALRLDRDSAPTVLRDDHLRKALIRCIDRHRRQERPPAGVEACALLLGVDGTLVSPAKAYLTTDSATRTLFAGDPFGIPFLHPGEAESLPGWLKEACRRLEPAEALIHCRKVSAAREIPPALADDLLIWFGRQEGSESWGSELAALPLFPTSAGRSPLRGLSLPGDFVDPLGLAALLEVHTRPWLPGLSKALGAAPLTFEAYLLEHLIPALRNGALSFDARQRAVRWLAREHGKIASQDSDRIGGELARTPVVLCEDGHWRSPREVHFRTAATEDLLGEKGPFAAGPGDDPNLGRFYAWAGVLKVPRAEAVLERLLQVVREEPPARAREYVTRAWNLFIQKTKDEKELPGTLRPLTTLRWLPARGDAESWHLVDEIVAGFNDYLCERSARILDLPRKSQEDGSHLMELLGIAKKPSTEQVIDHLLACRRDGESVHPEVYVHLGNAPDWGPERLGDGRVLWVRESGGATRFVKATEAFRTHPFGRMRATLSVETIERCGAFLRRMGFREEPTHADAVAVLKDVSKDYLGSGAREIGDDAAILHECWSLLTQASKDDPTTLPQLRRDLSHVRCVANQRGLLVTPQDALFNDRQDLTEPFGEFLASRLVDRQASTLPALEIAGVRHASDVIVVSANATDAREDVDVVRRVRMRSGLILRACEAAALDGGFDLVLLRSILEKLRVERASRLTRTLSITVEDDTQECEPAPTTACWDAGASTLFIAATDGRVRWEAVCRELAAALHPRGARGVLSSALVTVLQPAELEDAMTAARELGWRELSVEDVAQPMQLAPVEVGEGGVGDGTEPFADRGEDQAAAGHGAAWVSSGGTSSNSPPDVSGSGPSAGAGTTPMSNAAGASPPVAGRSGASSSPFGPSSPQRPASVSRSGRFRTYIESKGREETDPQGAAKRQEVDVAAVRAVVEYERRHGHEPVVMHHQNPGFDVRSGDRLIEVKGLSGLWSERGVGLTQREFETAWNEKFSFWLYVVETAVTNPRIYCIKDPAGRANQFFFDDGWKGVDESEADREIGLDGVAE